MKYIQCPDIFVPESIDDYRKTLFLGGGISNCPIWQDECVELLKNSDFIVINPRRKNFDITDKELTIQQIEWEHYHLRLSEWKLFWFPKETLCPITLYELGKYVTSKRLYVGVEQEYQKRLDIYIQTNLMNSNFCLHDNLNGLIYWIIQDYYKYEDERKLKNALIRVI